MAMIHPSHPGELIRETIDALREETGQALTIQDVADGLHTTRKTLSAIINGKQSVSIEMAIKLAAAFKNTTPQFWLQAQTNYDLDALKNTVNTRGIKVFVKAKAE